MSTLCGTQVCIAFNRESTETMERPKDLLYFLRLLLHCYSWRGPLEGISLEGRGADWKQHYGGICPPGFGEQLQGVALRRKEDTSKRSFNGV